MRAKLQCENCRRELGPELISCPRRDANKNCSYQIEESRVESAGWFFYILVGICVSLLALTGILMGLMPIWIDILLSLLLLFGLFLAATGIYLTAARQTTIFNNTTGQSWQQTTILGVSISQRYCHPIELLPWLGSPGREMRYPASVTQLYKDPNPADMLSTALLQLMAHKIVSLGILRIEPKIGREKIVFVFSPGEKHKNANIAGQLENKLIEVVEAGTQNLPYYEYRQKVYPRTYRAALTLKDLLLLTFEGQRPHPGNYLIDQYVGTEAVELGLGTIRGKTAHYLEPAANTRGKTALDIRSNEQLHRDFWITYPKIASELLMQLDLSIHSEIKSGTAEH